MAVVQAMKGLALPHHLVQRLSMLVTGHFLLLWGMTLVLAICYGATADGRFCSRHDKSHSTAAHNQRSVASYTSYDYIAAIAFLLFLALYIFLIFYKENFAYYDNDQFTDFSLRGIYFAPPIWLEAGRFFPLGFQEFNLVALFTHSAVGFHCLAVAQLIFVVVALIAVLREYSLVSRLVIVAAVMVTPSFVISFTGLIYTERNILFWMAVLLVSLYRYSRTRLRVDLVGCLVATQFVLYYKESAVLFIVGYAASRLLWEIYEARRSKLSWQEAIETDILSLGMLGLSAVWGLLFVGAMLPHHRFAYLAAHHVALGSVILAYLRIDWIPFIMLTILGIRLFQCSRAKAEIDLLWEPLAVGASTYFCVILGLGLVSGYYMAPVDFIGFPYAARAVLSLFPLKARLNTAVVAVLFACLLVHNIGYSAFRVIERKSEIASRTQLAEFVRQYAFSRGKTELFFPFATPYHLMGISSFLTYNGIPLAGQGERADGSARILIESDKDFPDGRCVDYREYRCAHASAPGKGALIVFLPDDNASMRDVEKQAKSSILLLSAGCELCIRYERWLKPFHSISAEFASGTLPENWQQLRIFKREQPLSPPGSIEPTPDYGRAGMHQEALVGDR